MWQAVDTVLRRMHDAGYAHCDIRPSNVIAVVVDNEIVDVRVIDLGISTPLGADIPEHGVPAYCTEHNDTVTSEVDFLALGIMFVALWLEDQCRLPWENAYTEQDMMLKRRAWVLSHWPELRIVAESVMEEDVLRAVDRLTAPL